MGELEIDELEATYIVLTYVTVETLIFLTWVNLQGTAPHCS